MPNAIPDSKQNQEISFGSTNGWQIFVESLYVPGIVPGIRDRTFSKSNKNT